MALKLTQYEQEMLDGKHGEAKQLAMKIMVKIGEPLGAEELRAALRTVRRLTTALGEEPGDPAGAPGR